MSKRLSAGDAAPDFAISDLDGNRVSLSALRGRPTMVAFHRFAACPFCNLRVHRLIEYYPALAQRNLAIVAFFESAAELLREGAGRLAPPFPLVPDPEGVQYAQYGVQESVLGTLRGVVRLPDMLEARRLKLTGGSSDGRGSRIPAEFLIDRDGRIALAYYGRDIGDHLPLDRVEAFAREHADASPANV